MATRSTGMGRAIEQMELAIAKKRERLVGMDEGGPRRAAEKELEALGESLERMRLEADEAFAYDVAGTKH